MKFDYNRISLDEAKTFGVSDPETIKAYKEALKGYETHPLYEKWINSGENGLKYILNTEGIEEMSKWYPCPLEEAVILDMGAGTGNGIIAFHLIGAGNCIGIDLLMEGLGLRLAQSRLKRYGIHDKLAIANGIELPFRNETFDIAFSHNVIEHIRDVYPYFLEMFRVLKQGGIGLIGTPNKAWPRDSHFGFLFSPWLPNTLLKYYAKSRGHYKEGELWDTYYRSTWSIIHMLRKVKFEIVATPQHYLKPIEKSRHKFLRATIASLLKLGLPVDYYFPNMRLCVRKKVEG